MQTIDSISQQNCRMLSKTISSILKSIETLPSESYGTVNSIRHELKYNYLPPIKTFEITEHQRANRLVFSSKHIQGNLFSRSYIVRFVL